MKLRFFPSFDTFKKRLPRIAIGILLTLIFCLQASSLITIPILDRLDGILYDSKVRLNALPGVDPRIVIVTLMIKACKNVKLAGKDAGLGLETV